MNKKIIIPLTAILIVLIAITVILPIFLRPKQSDLNQTKNQTKTTTGQSSTSETSAKKYLTNQSIKQKLPYETNDFRVEYSTDKNKVIIMAGDYHEGVIGLAAAKLVEQFYRPAIVFSEKKDISKASARSISGFNIIEVIRKLEGLYIEGGGHPMAAGFSIETSKIEEFAKEINKISKPLLTEEILSRKLKIDLEIDFNQINPELVERINQFEPTGLGNFPPSFMTKKVEVVESRTVGRDNAHLKLKLRQNSVVFDAIGFGLAITYTLLPNTYLDVVYSIEENIWNNHTNLQLKIRDIRPIR